MCEKKFSSVWATEPTNLWFEDMNSKRSSASGDEFDFGITFENPNEISNSNFDTSLVKDDGGSVRIITAPGTIVQSQSEKRQICAATETSKQKAQSKLQHV